MPDDEQLDFGELARRAREMQGDLANVAESLMTIRATGQGGGGLVRATVSGEGRILDLQMDPSVIDPDDPETLAEFVIQAVDGANQAMEQQRHERMTEVADGVSGLLTELRRERPKPNLVSRLVPRQPDGRTRHPGTPN
jgi:DNA-binding YbaB/EbfC family protein